ncbi:HD-GYP domain-containing protein [Conexibacter sp. DBS9H8]|uniref:HD-GYP domain-containing protein n=1 Tax=Conexibacter sp. DBS9H8 TaxID=2937801 RepID=UPI00200BF7C3|nr:HD domain-containing phosphohydrolase [Conexibacter sp. DBS9H8]
MRLIPTSRVTDGALLGADVQIGNSQGIPLLRRGVRLTDRLRDRLIALGVHAVYVEDAISEGICPEPMLDEDTRIAATKAVATAFRAARQAFERNEPLGEDSLLTLQQVVGRILERLESCGPAASLALADMASADGYTFQHSIDVATVGLVVARRYWLTHGWCDHQGVRRYDRIDSRLGELGMGLLLHDVGKLGIPRAILHKEGKLDAAEWSLMRRHPRMGVDLLATDLLSPLVKGVVLRHHERWNGSGYPDGRAREAIHEMARIAGVADTFDAIISERVYAPARPAADGVTVIREGAGTLFDPAVVVAFCAVVPPYPPGSEVTLPDGRCAIVVSVEEGHFDTPLVRTFDGAEEVVALGAATGPEALSPGAGRVSTRPATVPA